MNRDLIDLFDSLGDGLVLVGTAGGVIYANRAARHRFGAVRDDKLDAAISETLLRWRSLGYVSAASSVLIPIPGTWEAYERMLVSVFETGIVGQTALLIRSMSAGGGHGNVGQLLLESVAAEARAELRAGASSLGLAARRLKGLSDLGDAGVQALAWHCELGAGRIEALMKDLDARIRCGRDSLEAEADLAVLDTALNDAIHSVQAFCEQRSVKLTGGPGDASDLIVQGSGFLVSWAFRHLLRHVVGVARRGSQIQAGVRVGSSEIVVRIVVLPVAGAPPDEIATRLFAALGGSLARVSIAGDGSAAFVVRLPRQPDPVRDYFDAYAQIEREAGVLADLVIRRVAAAASRT